LSDCSAFGEENFPTLFICTFNEKICGYPLNPRHLRSIFSLTQILFRLKEITLEDKTANEQVRLIAELDEKDKTIVFGMIETMLTKKKFKDFFNKNVAML
jgi:hypothetical protein